MSSGIAFEQLIGRSLCNIGVEPKLESPETKERSKQKVIIIAGPTGCGKSDFAMMLAKAINGEILAADSMQVYRGMDIGTAKPTKEHRLQVPHHLLDIRDVSDPMNVVDFYHEACFCLHAIRDRETVPIVVGGSGFYLHTLLYGPPEGPPSSPDLRKVMEAELHTLGSDTLYERLCQQDPEYAKTITAHDRHKIVRALEIMALSGKKVSSLDWKKRTQPQKFDFHCWFLHRPRDHLYHRIERRCEKMVQDGLLDEVAALEKADIHRNSSAAQAIGYRQALDYLSSPRRREDYLVFLDQFKQASRRYAKRQLTWFRREPLYHWLDIEMHDFETAVEMIMREYEQRL